MLPWVSIAAFGAPAVPLVNNRAARWSGSTSTAGAGSAAMISLAGVASGISALSAATTVRSAGTDSRSTSRHAAAPERSTTTATAPTVAIWVVSSWAGLVGLSGTATAPMPSVAR